jgi:hypothetical protein
LHILHKPGITFTLLLHFVTYLFYRSLRSFIHLLVFVTRAKRFLPSSCLSVRPSLHLSARISTASTGRNFMKFYIGNYYENLSRTLKLFKIGKESSSSYEDLNRIILLTAVRISL